MYSLYTAKYVPTGKIVYVGLTHAFEQRKIYHRWTSILAPIFRRLQFRIVKRFRSKRKGQAAETTLQAKLKRRGQCRLNFAPSYTAEFGMVPRAEWIGSNRQTLSRFQVCGRFSRRKILKWITNENQET